MTSAVRGQAVRRRERQRRNSKAETAVVPLRQRNAASAAALFRNAASTAAGTRIEPGGLKQS